MKFSKGDIVKEVHKDSKLKGVVLSYTFDLSKVVIEWEDGKIVSYDEYYLKFYDIEDLFSKEECEIKEHLSKAILEIEEVINKSKKIPHININSFKELQKLQSLQYDLEWSSSNIY